MKGHILEAPAPAAARSGGVPLARGLLVLAAFALGAAPAALASIQDASVSSHTQRARVYRAAPGQALTDPSTAAPEAVVADFLRARHTPDATLRSLRVVSMQGVSASGVTHVRFEQRAAGLRVHDAYAKAAVDAHGALVHLIDALVPLPARAPQAARIGARDALRAALARVHPELKAVPEEAGRDGDALLFERGRFFHSQPRVERVAVPAADGALHEAFLVETWSRAHNRLHETLVAGDGRVLAVELRTNTDAYNVFPVDPVKTPQQIVTGPGAGNAESPIGWLFTTAQTSVDIAGNNAHAYLDTDADDKPDPGGTPVTDGNFLTAANLLASPATEGNRNVAVQNLFYLNNVIHDELYRHGFTEAAGNFQEDNFGLGGKDGDSVNAEAQDGSGVDNANFSTPRDGRNPRMQMYLWTGKGTHQVVVHAPAGIAGIYRAQGAAFGPVLTPTGVTADVTLVDDGTGTASDACETVVNDLTGRIALIDRGTCTFVVKVKNAQNAGAVAAIVANNAGDSLLAMAGDDPTITIGSVFIGLGDGDTLKSGLPGVNATVRLTDPPPLQRDGDVDSDIVWHEYGHGLTWRMIGRMNGALPGAVGEGVSDVLSILINDDDVVAEYAFDDPLGIRRFPYTGYPLTYADVTGAEVHDDGEIYAAIGWRLWEIFRSETVSRDVLLDYVVDGMNYTPAGPSFEEMRDGMLASATAFGAGHECLIWEAFAAFGVGVGAEASVRGRTITVTESFELPPQCNGRARQRLGS